jgi:hypothetical protein
MWWRYLRTNTIFAGVMAQALVERGVRELGLVFAAPLRSGEPRA